MFVARYDPQSETRPRQIKVEVESTLPGVLKQKQ
jgi:hypothetical protein